MPIIWANCNWFFIDDKPKPQLVTNKKIRQIHVSEIPMDFGWISGNLLNFGQKQLNTDNFHCNQSVLLSLVRGALSLLLVSFWVHTFM